MDVFTDCPDQLDREGEYYSVYEPGPGICFEIHKSRPFSLVCIRFQSSYDLCQPTFLVFSVFTHCISGHCNLSPPSCTPPPFLYSSPSCVLSRAPSSLSPSLLPIFYPLRPLPPDRASTRIIERFPFRDTLGWILSVRRRTLFSNENFYHLTRFFGGLVYVWESRRMRKDLIIERK